MRTLEATFKTLGGNVLVIGHKGDSGATLVRIDCREALEEYDGTTAAVQITSPDGTIYPGDVIIDNGVVLWTVVGRDTKEEGSGSVRVDLVDDEDRIIASAECPTVIIKTNQSGLEVTQIVDWTDAASVALSDVRAALLEFEQIKAFVSTNAQICQFEIDDNGDLIMYFTDGFPYRFAIEDGELMCYVQ